MGDLSADVKDFDKFGLIVPFFCKVNFLAKPGDVATILLSIEACYYSAEAY